MDQPLPIPEGPPPSPLLPILLTLLIFSIPLFIIFPPLPVSRLDALRLTHRRLGVPPRASRIADSIRCHLDEDGNTPTVHSLWVCPVKSCQGIELDKARVLMTGLEFDRLYMFAQLKSRFPVKVGESVGKDGQEDKDGDGEKWEFITLQQLPCLATVKVSLFLPDALKHSRALGPSSTHEPLLLIRFPNPHPSLFQTLAAKLSRRSWSAVAETEILLPVNYPSPQEIRERGWTTERVRIWRDTVPALNLEKELPGSLAGYLGVSNRLGLFRMDPAQRREIYRNAPRRWEVGYQPAIDFHDG